MRKNAASKWLHFILDLLPLVIIPIFAINIINRSPEPITVEVGETKQVVDVQYKYQSNEVNNLDDLVAGNVYHLSEFTFNEAYNDYDFICIALKYDSVVGFVLDSLDEYSFDGFNSSDLDNNVILFYYYCSIYESYTYVSYFSYDNSYCNLSCDNSDAGGFFVENIDFIYNDDMYNYFDDYNYLPSYSTFNVIESVDIYETGTTVVYDDTDIGSQFLYTVYHSVDEYFNFDNVFNFGELKSWLGTNLFGGTMPMVAVIVYNIIIYELMMDLLFLIYGVFMFIIDCGACMLEKPFDKMRGR